jgi:DNA-binding NarL/FixJ family response regulator
MIGQQCKILLVDDHALLRDMLATQLKAEAGLEVVGTADNADDAIELANKKQPDVLVMDIDMPGMICFDAARNIMATHPEIRILFLSAFFHDRYIEQALAVQARGYVTKRESPQIIIQAIHAIADGGTYFSDEVRSRIMVDRQGVRLAQKGKTRASTLTNRELEVLRYIARGMHKKEIAKTMYLSVKTVENYCAKLMDKLDIHDRVELTRYAIREGLAEP